MFAAWYSHPTWKCLCSRSEKNRSHTQKMCAKKGKVKIEALLKWSFNCSTDKVFTAPPPLPTTHSLSTGITNWICWMGLLDPVNGVLSDQSNLYTHTHTLQSRVHTQGMEDAFRVGARVRLSASDLESLDSPRVSTRVLALRFTVCWCAESDQRGIMGAQTYPYTPSCPTVGRGNSSCCVISWLHSGLFFLFLFFAVRCRQRSRKKQKAGSARRTKCSATFSPRWPLGEI